MYREHVMIDEEPRQAAPVGSQSMVKKAALMCALYLCAALIMAYALKIVGVDARLWRGMGILSLLWLCHLDAASWVARSLSGDTASGRVLVKAREMLERNSIWSWMLLLTPLASGLLALDWGGLSVARAMFQLVGAGLMWLFAIGIASSWISMMSPSRLAAWEACAPSKAKRMFIVAKTTFFEFAMMIVSWYLFNSVGEVVKELAELARSGFKV